MIDFKKWVSYIDSQNIDLFGYFGPISRSGYDVLCRSFPKQKRDQAVLVLGTYGGDPDAGYRIARALMHHYENSFKVIVPYYCKSAGTLICLGAHELLMADKSELGPLDVQLRKQDELFQQNSGLDIVRGIEYLNQSAISHFRNSLIEINMGSGVSTKTASEIASRLVIGLYEPVFSQVDPVKLGETGAALQIAAAYGERLSEKSRNLKPEALTRLIHGYPSHSFVIDRAEARLLFENVKAPDGTLLEIAKETQKKFWDREGPARVLYLNEAFHQAIAAIQQDAATETEEEDVNQVHEADGAAHTADGSEREPGHRDHSIDYNGGPPEQSAQQSE